MLYTRNMTTSLAKQALRKLRKEQGLCIHCGAPGDRGTRCTRCADRDSENRKRYAERDQALGICRNTGCSNKVTGTNHHCDKCIQKTAAQTAKRRANRVKLGLCGQCGLKPRMEEHQRCVDCQQKMKDNHAVLHGNRTLAGLCIRCGKNPPAEAYKYCLSCVDLASQYHRARKLLILDKYGGPVCVGCGETEICVLQVDHINGGGSKHAKEIGGRGKMYTWIIDNDFPTGFRILCANCNIRALRGVPFPNDKEP